MGRKHWIWKGNEQTKWGWNSEASQHFVCPSFLPERRCSRVCYMREGETTTQFSHVHICLQVSGPPTKKKWGSNRMNDKKSYMLRRSRVSTKTEWDLSNCLAPQTQWNTLAHIPLLALTLKSYPRKSLLFPHLRERPHHVEHVTFLLSKKLKLGHPPLACSSSLQVNPGKKPAALHPLFI